MNPSNPWSGPYQNPHIGAPIPDPRTNTRVPSYTSNSTSPFTSTMSTSAHGGERRDGAPQMMNRKHEKQMEEGFEDRERINRAALILGSRDLLVFHGMGNDETVPQTRLRFEKQLCGIANDDEDDGAWVDVIEEDEDKGGKVGWGLDREERKGSVRKRVTGGSGGMAKGKESEKRREGGSGSRG